MIAGHYEPDYIRLVAACRNTGGPPFPLYEHNVSVEVVEALLGRSLAPLADGDEADRIEFFRAYAGCLASLGYDTVPFEGCVTELIQGGEALCGRAGALVKNRADIEAFDWNGTVERYMERFGPSFRALAAALPQGMKAHGGVGNGVFETVQDFVPLTEIAYMQIDDPEVSAAAGVQGRRPDGRHLGAIPERVRRVLCLLPIRRRPGLSEFSAHTAE